MQGKHEGNMERCVKDRPSIGTCRRAPEGPWLHMSDLPGLRSIPQASIRTSEHATEGTLPHMSDLSEIRSIPQAQYRERGACH
jgi:hypothetical protein